VGVGTQTPLLSQTPLQLLSSQSLLLPHPAIAIEPSVATTQARIRSFCMPGHRAMAMPSRQIAGREVARQSAARSCRVRTTAARCDARTRRPLPGRAAALWRSTVEIRCTGAEMRPANASARRRANAPGQRRDTGAETVLQRPAKEPACPWKRGDAARRCARSAPCRRARVIGPHGHVPAAPSTCARRTFPRTCCTTRGQVPGPRRAARGMGCGDAPAARPRRAACAGLVAGAAARTGPAGCSRAAHRSRWPPRRRA
jgi:hypothetical protein